MVQKLCKIRNLLINKILILPKIEGKVFDSNKEINSSRTKPFYEIYVKNQLKQSQFPQIHKEFNQLSPREWKEEEPDLSEEK